MTLSPAYVLGRAVGRAEARVERGELWHCTLADKAAMDANLLAVEARAEALEEALIDVLNIECGWCGPSQRRNWDIVKKVVTDALVASGRLFPSTEETA